MKCMNKVNILSKMDYEHWCREAGVSEARVYKDTVEFEKDGRTIILQKSMLTSSPVEMKLNYD